MNPYSYSCNELRANLHLEKTTSRWSRYRVDFPTAHPTRYEENNTVRGEYLRPVKAGSAPLAILVHGLGGRSVIPCRLLARTLLKKGIACFILYLVFHSSRMPETMKNRVPALTAEEWFEGYQISVIDIRQVIDWAGGRPEIDNQRIAVIGISLGGLVSAIAMGVDERIKAGIFIVSGGNSEEITWRSKNPAIQAGSICTEAECHRIHEHYPQYLLEVAEKGFENVTPIKPCFLTDAMTFTPYLRGRPILMLNAIWDEYIPRQATLDFWKACGQPDISWLPATHASIWLAYPFIHSKVTKFFKSTFGPQEESSVWDT